MARSGAKVLFALFCAAGAFLCQCTEPGHTGSYKPWNLFSRVYMNNYAIRKTAAWPLLYRSDPKVKDPGDQLDLHPFAHFFIHANMGHAIFVVKFSGGQRPNVTGVMP